MKKQNRPVFTTEGFVMAREKYVNHLLRLNKVDEEQLPKLVEFVASVLAEAESMVLKKGCREKSCYDRGYVGVDDKSIPVLCICTKLKIDRVFKKLWAEKKEKEVTFQKKEETPAAPTPETPNAPSC